MKLCLKIIPTLSIFEKQHKDPLKQALPKLLCQLDSEAAAHAISHCKELCHQAHAGSLK